MKLGWLLALIILVVCLVGWWSASGGREQISISPNGFVPTEMPLGADDGQVLILAPLDCNCPDGQRGDELAAYLTKLGIPNVRSDTFSTYPATTEEERAAHQRAVEVMNSNRPGVFIRGMGASNPSNEAVAAEYRRLRR